jgi:hypothetical protein
MKIWIDAQETFQVEAFSLRDLGLWDARDVEIFAAAQAEDDEVVIMTKDSDFVDLVCRLGIPPQILWLSIALAPLKKGDMSSERMEWEDAIVPKTLKVPLTKGDLGGSGFGGKQRVDRL